MRSLVRLALAASLAVAAAPLASVAHDGHCLDVFLLSGVDTGASRAGSNPGAASCTQHEPELPDTNYTIPGATHAWAAAFSTMPMPTGFATVGGGDPIALTFFKEPVRDRWESNSLDLSGALPGAQIVVTVDFGDDNVQTLTYTRI